MQIQLENVSKRFLYNWIFKSINSTLFSPSINAIEGPNGSGKSTLLKIISGQLSPSKGKILFKDEKGIIPVSKIYQHISFAAPYMDLVEEFTLKEAITFHHKFKPRPQHLSFDEMLNLTTLAEHHNKQIKFFSSGMKQRLKLSLAFCNEAPVLLLDEPTSYLDVDGRKWFHSMLKTYSNNKIVIIASNDMEDLISCSQSINVHNYKNG